MKDLTALARDILARAERPIPRYGSDEWIELPENDLRRVAAVIVAAECWRDYTSPETVFEDLIESQRVDDALVLARIRATSADVRDGLPPGWAGATTNAELKRRRAA